MLIDAHILSFFLYKTVKYVDLFEYKIQKTIRHNVCIQKIMHVKNFNFQYVTIHFW